MRHPFPHRPALAAAALLVLATRQAGAQGTGGTAAVLLALPASARAAAMGDAGGAPGWDAAGFLYNPALVAARDTTAPRAAGALSVERYLAGATLAAGAATLRAGPGVVAVGVRTLAYPDAAEIVADAGSPTGGRATGGTVRAHDVALAAGYALALGRAQVGAAIGWVGEYLPGASGGTATLDVGAGAELARSSRGTLLATAAVQHLGGDLDTGAGGAPLPRTARLGLALDDVAALGGRWTPVVEATVARGADAVRRAGVEGRWRARSGVGLQARAGYVAGDGDSRQAPLTVGGGLSRGALALDYAWRRFDTLGDTHRVGVRWSR